MRHFMRPNHDTRYPSVMIALDTETRGEKLYDDSTRLLHRLYCGTAIRWRWEKGVATRRHCHNFRTPNEWWTWLRDQVQDRRTTWVWAHKAVFDLTVLDIWHEIEKGRIIYESLADGDPPFYLACMLEGCKVVFVDLMNWHRCPLSDLGEVYGLPKLPMPDKHDALHKWQEYCLRDTEIVEAAACGIVDMVTRFDMGNLRLTAAGQAMALYRHRLGKRFKISDVYQSPDPDSDDAEREGVYPISHNSEHITKLERESHYGGAAECYRVGRVEGPIYLLDATAYYPSLMANHLYPTRLLGVRQQPSVKRAWDLAYQYASVATVLVASHTAVFPRRLKDITVRARGEFWTALAGPELLYAFESDMVGAVGELAYYEQDDIFTRFVQQTWNMRLALRIARDKPGELLIKLISNSLHGKFSQRVPKWVRDEKATPWREWGRWSIADAGDDCVYVYRAVGGNVDRRVDDEEPAYTFPLISSYVCSYGRLVMDQWVRLAGHGNVLYTAVDGLHVNADGYAALNRHGCIQHGAIGKLRLESVHDWVHYYGVNAYVTPAGPKAGGLSRKAVEIRPGMYRQGQMQSAKQIIEREPLPGVYYWDDLYMMERPFRHGNVGENGVVTPYVYNDRDSEGWTR